tara:strand:- start:593 stop:799 length:207 start_codon:yes stop_codon:yes gene_type:complete
LFVVVHKTAKCGRAYLYLHRAGTRLANESEAAQALFHIVVPGTEVAQVMQAAVAQLGASFGHANAVRG